MRMQFLRGLFLAAALSLCLSACERPGEEETIPLAIGASEEGSRMYRTGMAVADAVNGTIAGARAAAEETKGDPLQILGLKERTLSMGLVSGKTAYDAFYGLGAYEGAPMEELRAIGAVGMYVSVWTAGEETGIEAVSDLPGKCLAVGDEASMTAEASACLFSVLGIDGENTELWAAGIGKGTAAAAEGSADAAHGFDLAPMAGQEAAVADGTVRILPYEAETVQELVGAYPWYCGAHLPAGTYTGQKEDVQTFGMKVLLCVRADMEDELAYQTAMALDIKGDAIAAAEPWLWAAADKEALCKELPIPLHEGAEAYYRETGYLK